MLFLKILKGFKIFCNKSWYLFCYIILLLVSDGVLIVMLGVILSICFCLKFGKDLNCFEIIFVNWYLIFLCMDNERLGRKYFKGEGN